MECVKNVVTKDLKVQVSAMMVVVTNGSVPDADSLLLQNVKDVLDLKKNYETLLPYCRITKSSI